MRTFTETQLGVFLDANPDASGTFLMRYFGPAVPLERGQVMMYLGTGRGSHHTVAVNVVADHGTDHPGSTGRLCRVLTVERN